MFAEDSMKTVGVSTAVAQANQGCHYQLKLDLA
jgi:hypothetical protein